MVIVIEEVVSRAEIAVEGEKSLIREEGVTKLERCINHESCDLSRWQRDKASSLDGNDTKKYAGTCSRKNHYGFNHR